jgi:hypothetical protein
MISLLPGGDMDGKKSFLGSRGARVSASSVDRRMKLRLGVVIRGAAILITVVLFLPVLSYAQGDTLILLGRNTEMYHIYAVSAYNKNAFVADVDHGLRVINYSDPYDPYMVTRYPEPTRDVEIRDSMAYCAGTYALHIRNISSPLEQEIVGSYPTAEGFRVHLFDSLALLLYESPWEYVYLDIIDISDPANPQALSAFIDVPALSTVHWGDIWKRDNYIYWVDEEYFLNAGKIIVYDIADPTDPVLVVVDTCLQARPNAIWIKGDYAYVADDYGAGGVTVLDVSDPYNIDSVGCFEIPEGRAWNIFIEGDYAYVCAHLQPVLDTDRLYILNISDPTSPSLVASYDTPYSPKDVFVDKPYVLVADYTSLLIFEASFLVSDVPGDVNYDKLVNVSDVVYLVNYLYKAGCPPVDPNLADVNGDCEVNVGDVVYLTNYLYKNGPAPLAGCAE